MTIRAITFDLDDTLWPLYPTLKKAERETYDWLRRHASDITDAYSLKAIGEYRWRLFQQDPQWQHQISLVRIETIRQLAIHCGYTDVNAKRIAEQAFQVHYKLRQQVNCYPGVTSMLNTLNNRYLLGSISNGNADAKTTEIGNYLAFSISAEQIKASKPDPAIFKLALSTIQEHLEEPIRPEQVVHVGDDFHCDITGAAEQGFKTIWLDHPPSNEHTTVDNSDKRDKDSAIEPHAPRADQTITEIAMLPAALEKLIASQT